MSDVTFDVGVFDKCTKVYTYENFINVLREGRCVQDLSCDEYRGYYVDPDGDIYRQYIPIDDEHRRVMDNDSTERGNERMEFVLDSLNDFPNIVVGDVVSGQVKQPTNPKGYVTLDHAIDALRKGKTLVSASGNHTIVLRQDGTLSENLVVRNINRVSYLVLEDVATFMMSKSKKDSNKRYIHSKLGYSRIGRSNKY